jgi:LmbE family N-acetylglucosaminyl deacetylase
MRNAISCVALVAAVQCVSMSVGAATDDFPSAPALRPEDSILVVSPHPDDESLCCGGLIATAQRVGAKVAIVWVTSGDGFTLDAMVVEKKVRPRASAYHELARRRIAEARSAATSLKVPHERQYFLGYPDRGILPILFDHYSKTWRSKYTGDTEVPFPDELRPGATYDGEDLVEDFTDVVERVAPTLVLAPSPQDTHPDHRASGLLALRVMTARNQHDRLRFWLVHGGRGWPRPRGYRPELAQTVAPRGQGMPWEQFPLDELARSAKREAIGAHETQMKVMSRVMLSHVRTIELYSTLPVPPSDASCLELQACEFEEAPPEERAGL